MVADWERRRGARIPGRLQIQVAAVDEEPVVRRGDISMSGIYVETEESIGAPGSVQALTIAAIDQDSWIDILARVIRVVVVQDLWHGPGVAGAAMEFLPVSPQQREVLERIIHQVMVSKAYSAQSVRIDSGFEAHVDPAALNAVRPQRDAIADQRWAEIVGVPLMVIETNWPVKVGEMVRCDLETESSDRRTTLTGRVVRSTLEPAFVTSPRYRVELDFVRPLRDIDRKEVPHEDETARVEKIAGMPSGPSISDAIDALLEDVLFPPAADELALRARSPELLNGSLARVRLGNLLSVFELEGLTGVLQILSADNGEAAVFVRDGQVIDAQLCGDSTGPHEVLRALCQWKSGNFELKLMTVEREDRIGMKTSELLAKLAHA